MLKVDSVAKTFKLYHSPRDRLLEALFGGRRHAAFAALQGVTFHVAAGETLGIIGPNGAGKSTLLKILTGIIRPDRGAVAVGGRVTGLLELGTGFNPELSGARNVDLNGLLLGMTQTEIDERRAAIVAFAELGEFINEPLKTYSSGMMMRLAFAIAVHADPACLIVDEALSVGDAHFQQKCFARIQAFKRAGGSIVFVSHDLGAVKMLCDRALLLDRGRVVEAGAPDTVVNAYNFLIARLNEREQPVRRLDEGPGQGTAHAFGSLEGEIEAVEIEGEHSRSSLVAAGERTRVTVTARAARDLAAVTCGILIRDRYGQDVFGTNTFYLGAPASLRAGVRYAFTFDLRMDLGPGEYTLTAALHDEHNHIANCFHWIDQAASFEVAGYAGPVFTGLCRLTPRVEWRELDAADKRPADAAD